MGGVCLRENAQPCALEHGVGQHAAAAGFQVVALPPRLIHHLPVYAGGFIGVGEDARHHFPQ